MPVQQRHQVSGEPALGLRQQQPRLAQGHQASDAGLGELRRGLGIIEVGGEQRHAVLESEQDRLVRVHAAPPAAGAAATAARPSEIRTLSALAPDHRRTRILRAAARSRRDRRAGRRRDQASCR